MRPIPAKLVQKLERMPAMRMCMRRMVFHDHMCQGRITWEHAWTYAGRQINEWWAIIAICEWAHDLGPWLGAGNLDKKKNQYISLLRAEDEDLAKYPRTDWPQKKKYLYAQYGIPGEYQDIA